MYVLNSSQMYKAECNAVGRGATFPQLMEKAGTACAERIYEEFRQKAKNVLVVCGKGKNGGDGFVIARRLYEKGLTVRVLLACGSPAAQDAVANFEKLDKGIEVTDISKYVSPDDAVLSAAELIGGSDLIVDAVFGTGFRGKLDDNLSRFTKLINSSGVFVASIDVPTGLDCDTGEYDSDAVAAGMTMAISALKPGHIMKKSRKICGKTVLVDIGISDEDMRCSGDSVAFTQQPVLPFRPEDANKGTFGKALCVCGSRNMPGAACLAVTSALRTGAGLVTAAFPEGAYAGIASKVTEALMLSCPCNSYGTFSAHAIDTILSQADKADAVLVGCGLGLNDDTEKLVYSLISSAKAPLVIDADGLNALSRNPSALRSASVPVVITPHPGEMSRLCDVQIQDITSDPVNYGQSFADKYGCTVVLKSSETRVFSPNGKLYYVNTTGNNCLSKGGSGDMLAGILVSLLAQGMSPAEAAQSAVWLHGDIADRYVAGCRNPRAVLPSDLISFMKKYDFSQFEQNEREQI